MQLSPAGVSAARAGEVADATTFMPALDGVRALAVGAVFLLHLNRVHFPGGALGVDVFFALSAYLITGILLAEQSRGPVQFGAFYWRRAFRLVPALVLWGLLIASPTAGLAHTPGMIPVSLGGALFYANDFLQAWTGAIAAAFDQSWSLAVEEQFYLLWPAILVFGVCRLSASLQRMFFYALIAAGGALLFRGGDYFLPTGHLLPLALGCWAAWQKARNGPPAWASQTRNAVGAVSLMVLGTTLFISPQPVRWHQGVLTCSVALAAIGLIVSLADNRPTPLTRLFGSTIPRWVGARSYGIYLYGLTLIQLVGDATHLKLHYAAPIAIAATLVVSELSYRYVESPARIAGRRWLQTRNQSIAGEAAST